MLDGRTKNEQVSGPALFVLIERTRDSQAILCSCCRCCMATASFNDVTKTGDSRILAIHAALRRSRRVGRLQDKRTPTGRTSGKGVKVSLSSSGVMRKGCNTLTRNRFGQVSCNLFHLIPPRIRLVPPVFPFVFLAESVVAADATFSVVFAAVANPIPMR